MKFGQEQGIGSEQTQGAVVYCVCCHLAAPTDYFKMKRFDAIASLGNLAEHSSRFIDPPQPPRPHKTLQGSSLASLNKNNHW